jgi:hypothetical protein
VLVGERLDRRVDAEELLRIVDVDTSFPAATRTAPDRKSDLQRAELETALIRVLAASWQAVEPKR